MKLKKLQYEVLNYLPAIVYGASCVACLLHGEKLCKEKSM